MNLQDKVIVVTGGARGLGYAMAERLGQSGAILAVIDLMKDELDEAVKQLSEAGIRAHAYTCNVADETAVETTFAAVVGQLGRLDGVINNAGILRDGLLLKVKDGEVVDRMSLAQWQAVIDVNLTGVFLCGRAAAAHMVSAGNGGVILNISSISRLGNFGQSNYSAAKAGVAAMTVTWANELSRYGIRCAGIAPGFVMTDMVASMKPDALERVSAGIPVKRLGRVEELAAAAQFIFENEYFNGKILELDGGGRL